MARRFYYCVCCNASYTKRDFDRGYDLCECGQGFVASEAIGLLVSGCKPLARIMPDGQLLGTAADGTEVQLGHILQSRRGMFDDSAAIASIESYLKVCPGPDAWR